MVNYLARFLSSSIAKPLISIEKNITEVAKGILPELTISSGKDEVSGINNALYRLIEVQKHIVHFSENIGKGNFDISFSPRSEQDTMGNALISMKNELLNSKEAADKRRWANEGLSNIAEILRKNDDLEEATNKVVVFLSKYTDARVVGLYISEKEAEEKVLHLKACYAYNREKIIEQSIKAGFGLIGQVFLEGKTTCLSKIPENYLNIRSGLGDSAPRFLAIIPLVYNDEVSGILELAAFKQLPDHVITFLEKAAENIAAAIINLYNNTETNKLLEQSQQRGLALREKENMMQQYVEELEASKETFKLKENKLKKEIAQLKEQNSKGE
jgi:hypothetical protein